MKVKRYVPWWGKIAAKIVLARIPVSYRRWQRLNLFIHGGMDSPDYAWRVVSAHLARTGWPDFSGRVVLELGPGDSLFSSVIAHALGAAATYLVDTGAYARADLAPYIELHGFMAQRGLHAPDPRGFTSVPAYIEACGGRYLTGGIASLRELPPSSVDLAFSQAVLEHVRLGEFDDTLREVRRVLRPGGLTSHQVDLKDHLGGQLNHLRLPGWLWETEFMARSGFYTNRLRFSSILASFQQAGLQPTVTEVVRWDALPTRKRRLTHPFRDLPDSELAVSQFDVVAAPR